MCRQQALTDCTSNLLSLTQLTSSLDSQFRLMREDAFGAFRVAVREARRAMTQGSEQRERLLL